MSFDPLPLQNSIFSPFETEVKVENFQNLFFEDDKCNTHFQTPQKKIKNINIKAKDKVKKQRESGRLVGHWNMIEKKRYHWFLQMFHGHFENKYMRRMDKIFKSMADFIGSRAADQCRSHHQKMQKKFKTFHNIIYNLRISNYNTIDISEMQEELKNNQIQIPDSLIDAQTFSFWANSIKQNVQSRDKEDYKLVKLQNIEFLSQQELKYQKRFDFMQEPPHEPLI